MQETLNLNEETNEDDLHNFYEQNSRHLPTTRIGATLEEAPSTYPTQKILAQNILMRIKLAFEKLGIPDMKEHFKTFSFQVCK